MCPILFLESSVLFNVFPSGQLDLSVVGGALMESRNGSFPASFEPRCNRIASAPRSRQGGTFASFGSVFIHWPHSATPRFEGVVWQGDFPSPRNICSLLLNLLVPEIGIRKLESRPLASRRHVADTSLPCARRDFPRHLKVVSYSPSQPFISPSRTSSYRTSGKTARPLASALGLG